MIIVFKPEATEKQIQHVLEKVKTSGFPVDINRGAERTIIGIKGKIDQVARLRIQPFEAFPGVEKVVSISAPFKLVSRQYKPQDTVIDIEGIKIGGKKVVVMAGPCSVESREIMLEVAKKVKLAGARILRGGAFKPRTSPYSFQGLGEEGLQYLHEAKEKTGLPIVTELMDPRQIALVEKYADILQIGARNMQNFDLLKEVGRSKKPVLLKRGMGSTVEELLMSAEYIVSEGNPHVILCERGIRTFESATRFTLDINAIPVIKQLSHLPVVADPSHATGQRSLVASVAKAALAAGADGLIIEVHTNPEIAKSDGPQSLLPSMFSDLMEELKKVGHAIGREI
ncbi:MAG: 3-deoxy-7-phosphoheptulonate synthase [Candidatus Omnitrophica bacterium]|nr:3-deoxy-7-phosphoheptulonate synthase [Candidatus Omnitrophota bacterium]